MSKSYLGLALGGGGARGAAHIGAIQTLHSAGVRPDIIAGTSAGSTVGAMYAATLDPKWIEERFREFMGDDSFRQFNSGELLDGRNQETFLKKVTSKVKQHYMVILGLNKSFVASRKILEKAVDYLLPVDTFEELKIPLKIVATDINTGDDIVHEEGDVKEAIVRSSSIPGFFEPTHNDGRLLVDGKVSIGQDSQSLKERINISYNGFVEITILINNSGSLVKNPIVSFKGIPNEEDNDFIFELKDSIRSICKTYSLNNNNQEQNLIEAVKTNCRKTVKNKTGKRPYTNVNLVRI